MSTLALILAAGNGERLGAGRPKALVELCGRPLLHWSVETMLSVAEVQRVVLALPPGVGAPEGTVGVEGGAVRSESVARALAAGGPGDPGDLVLVHDAARPLVSAELVRRSLTALTGEQAAGLDAAIAAVPVSDTIKRVREGVVAQTLDRAELWAVQTPQVFRRAALERALDVSAEVMAQATDDAWLVERTGGRVAVVPAGGDNLKVTTPLDLALAELLIARRQA